MAIEEMAAMDTVRVNLLNPESNVMAPPKAGPTAAQRRQGLAVAAVLVVMLAASGSRYLGGHRAAAPALLEASPTPVTTTFLVDPVCNGLVDPGKAKYAIKVAGSTILFEHAECAAAFRSDPIRYAKITNRVKYAPSGAPVATAPSAPVPAPSDMSLPDDTAVTAPAPVPAPAVPAPAVPAPVTEPAPAPQAVPGYPQGFSQVPAGELPQPAMQAPPPAGTKVPTLPPQTIDAKPTPESDAPSVEEAVPGATEPTPLGMPKAHH